MGCPPAQDSSHHQDYEPFLGSGIPTKTFISTITGKGDNPIKTHGISWEFKGLVADFLADFLHMESGVVIISSDISVVGKNNPKLTTYGTMLTYEDVGKLKNSPSDCSH